MYTQAAWDDAGMRCVHTALAWDGAGMGVFTYTSC